MTQAKSESLKYTMYTQNLSPDVAELFELSQLAGLVFDPQVFKIIVELLRLNIAPTAIERMLKSMCLQHQKYHQRNIEITEPASTRGRPVSANSSRSSRSGSLR